MKCSNIFNPILCGLHPSSYIIVLKPSPQNMFQSMTYEIDMKQIIKISVSTHVMNVFIS